MAICEWGKDGENDDQPWNSWKYGISYFQTWSLIMAFYHTLPRQLVEVNSNEPQGWVHVLLVQLSSTCWLQRGWYIYWPRFFWYGDVTLIYYIYFNGIWPSTYGEIWPSKYGVSNVSRFPRPLTDATAVGWPMLALSFCESELQIPSQRSQSPQGIPKEFMIPIAWGIRLCGGLPAVSTGWNCLEGPRRSC